MKKILSLLIIFTMVFSLAACGKVEAVVQDESPVTMFVTLGNGEAYYTRLAEMIEQDLGIDVELVYQINCNTSDMLRLRFKENDLPADIVFTASKTNDDYLKDSCIDLLSSSSISSLFTPTTIQGCTTEEGAIYQLPVSSKLIGITYNETLLKEMGWQVPENFEDMVELKAKCDAAGVPFAVFDSLATGHGFNWLFHLMGSQWLSTPEGTEWLEGFQRGERSVDEFKEECEYFRKWTEAGLWGIRHADDWNGVVEFQRIRALFWFGLTNGCNGYEGPMYDLSGNETGRTLSDTYKTIPWISEDGSNNCFTYYDNSWIYVNKSLEAENKTEKLEKVMKILEYLTLDQATQLVSDTSKDTYVSVNNYEIGEDRIYASYNESIKNGFVQPWYYNWFDGDSINSTGAVINDYLAGTGSFDEIFETLDKYNQLHLNNEIDAIAEFSEGLDYEDTARLVALCAAQAVNMSLEESGASERVQVALAPYTPQDNMLQPWRAASVCNSYIYEGPLDASMANYIFPADCTVPCAVRMTGAEIKAIAEKGYDPSSWFTDSQTGASSFDSENYGPYPYVCLVKDGEDLADDQVYLVAMFKKFVTKTMYESLESRGAVLEPVKYTMVQGLEAFAEKYDQIGIDNLAL